MASIEEMMCRYLEANEERLLSYWMEQVIVSPEENAELIYQNGKEMYRLVLLYLRKQINKEQIRLLSHKVAHERVQAGVNIGDFILNVSLGRSAIFHHLYELLIPLEHLQPIINTINDCFDIFLHYAVSKYTEYKDHDLEEKKQFIQQTHKDRLTILGQMSASFVHEFRNPLTSVMGFVKLLQREHPNLKYLDIMQHELEQLNFRISQFLLISRRGELNPSIESFPLRTLTDQILEFIYPSIAYGDVEVEVQIEDTITLNGNRDEMKQVILNLILNSIDALQEVPDHKRVKIEAAATDQAVTLTVENNGPAIPSEMLIAIFEPFVTTKDLGTGLGLFVCKQIVEKHGGTIHCDSTDEYTRFTLYFQRQLIPVELSCKSCKP